MESERAIAQDKLRESMAALAHEQWSGWMAYMFGKCIHGDDGSITIPPDVAKRWTRQMATPYEQLPESERESDRAEADKMIRLLRGHE